VVNKSPEAFRTISEVADVLDVPPHVLRFWETRFTQVKPVKRGGGRRYYRPEDVCLLRGIRGLLYDDGMTIKGVQKILRERGIRHVIGLGTLAEAEPDIVPSEPALEPKRAAARPNGSKAPDRSQADLFGETETSQAETDTLVEVIEVAAEAADQKAGRREALKALVGKLEALRAVMARDAAG
jgi:DNA-binding transcriptional MerR regulator